MRSNVRIPTPSGQTLNHVAVIITQTTSQYECRFDDLAQHNYSWMTAEMAVVGRGDSAAEAKSDFVQRVLKELAE